MQTSSQKISGLEAFREKLLRFFFAPASPLPLAWLRITLSGTLLVQAWLVSPDLYELYGSSGIMQETLARALVDGSLPRLSWILPLFERLGASEKNVILGASIFYIFSLSALLLGSYTRVAAFCAWLLHWTLMNTGYHTNYGADSYAHIFLFYLIWMPSGLALSVDSIRKDYSLEAPDFVRLSVRVIQIHLCVSYFSSGVEKAMGPQWQNGEVIWRALSLPVYQQFDMSWLASYPWIAKIFSWGTLVVELGYGVFIWPRQTRKVWLFLTLSLHLGIAVFLGLHIFGFLMLFFSLCIFGISVDLSANSRVVMSNQNNVERRADAIGRAGSNLTAAMK